MKKMPIKCVVFKHHDDNFLAGSVAKFINNPEHSIVDIKYAICEAELLRPDPMTTFVSSRKVLHSVMIFYRENWPSDPGADKDVIQ